MKFRVDDLVMYQGHLYLVSEEPSEEYPTYEIVSYPYCSVIHDANEDELHEPQVTRFVVTIEAYVPKEWARQLPFHYSRLLLSNAATGLGTTTQQEDLPDRKLYQDDLSPFIGREFEPDTNDEF